MLWLALCHSLRFEGYAQGTLTQVPWTYDFVHLTWADYRALYWRGSLRWTGGLSALRLRLELSQEALWGNPQATSLTQALWDTTWPLEGYLLSSGPGSVQRLWFKEAGLEARLGPISAGLGRRFADWGLGWFASPLRLFSKVERLGWDPEALTPTDCAWAQGGFGALSLEALYSLDTAWGLRVRAFSPVELGGLAYAGRDTALGLFSSCELLDGAVALEAGFFKGRRPGYSAQYTRTLGETFLLAQLFVNPWAGPPGPGLFARELAFLSLQRQWGGVWEGWLALAYSPSDGSAALLASFSRLLTGLKLSLGASLSRGREFKSQFGVMRPAGAFSAEVYR